MELIHEQTLGVRVEGPRTSYYFGFRDRLREPMSAETEAEGPGACG